MSKNFKVYLAGPITGQTFYDAENSWRASTAKAFLPNIIAYSPLRDSEFLQNEGVLNFSDYPGSPLTSSRGIMARDHYDCLSSDLIFVNLLGATRVSIGTVIEMAWAFSYRKPLVCCIEKSGNPHEHGMIKEAIDYRVSSLEEGIDISKSILLSRH